MEPEEVYTRISSIPGSIVPKVPAYLNSTSDGIETFYSDTCDVKLTEKSICLPSALEMLIY
jgi:hypothetical protein